MLLKMFSICPRRKTIAKMTAIAMTAMMSAYSTRPWPSSSRLNRWIISAPSFVVLDRIICGDRILPDRAAVNA
jgi:hypothetical protein